MKLFDACVINDVTDFFRTLNSSGVRYVTINDIIEKDSNFYLNERIRIIIHPEEYARYMSVMEHDDFKKVKFVYKGNENYSFLYGMKEIVSHIHEKTSIKVDACDKLYTKSLGRRAFIPVDNIIQKSIWQDRVWYEKGHYWKLDDANFLLYVLMYSIFEMEEFLPSYVKYIEKNKKILLVSDFQAKLRLVFFHFTPYLVKIILSGDYNSIRKKYISFTDY